jgi:hypothetical protein
MSDQLTTQKSSPLLSRLHIEPEERLGIRETFGRNGGVADIDKVLEKSESKVVSAGRG